MSDTSNTTIEQAQVRRAPRVGVFLLLGVALGIIVALILTFAFDGTADKSPFTTVQYSLSQVFGFLALICGTIGLAVGGVVALILDRTIGRRTRTVTVAHEHVTTPED